MNQDLQEKRIDVTGVELTPGEPTVCLGNGERGFECCCDACDYYLLCFPEFDPKNKEEKTAVNKGYMESSRKTNENNIYKEKEQG